MAQSRKKVVLAMSGGVDSSVAAALLLRQGYDVLGCFMRLGTPKGVEGAVQGGEQCETPAPEAKHKQGCCSVLDAADARRVAGLLGVPFYVLNFEQDFGKIIDYFVGEYNRGRTPNPCVRCNDWLKFGKLHQYAEAVGADFVASGHYARVEADPATGRRRLMRGRDHHKDQSYVLFGMKPHALDRTMLPLGDLEKPQVRAIAEELKLPVFNKPDSQEICFVPDQDYAGLIRRRTPKALRPGEFVTPDGSVVGAHEGHQQFTVGQRKGLRIAMGRPVYVTDIDPATNRVTIGDRADLKRSSLIAQQLNILDDRLVIGGETIRCSAKIRYNADPQPAMAQVTAEDTLSVHFDSPQSAITPGQAVVLYDGELVLGGGWIESSR